IKVLFCKRAWHATNDEVDIALAQFAKFLRDDLRLNDIDQHTRILARKPVNDRRHQSSRDDGNTADSHFAGGGIGQEFDRLYTLFEFIEGGEAVIKQGTAVDRGLDTVAAAIE